MRAPPLSFRPITGAPTFIAMSMILQILPAWRAGGGPPAVVQPAPRRPAFPPHVHDLADLAGGGGGEPPAVDGEVLAEDEHQPAVNRAGSGHDAVAGDLLRRHAEIGAVMLDIHVELL